MADEEYIRVSEPRANDEIDRFLEMDPFRKSWSDLKGFSNIDPNFKRSVTRKASASKEYLDSAKAKPSGVGAQSSQINPGEVNTTGYGVFDVITPPYDLYMLSSFYDTSFANHAAIDVKVSTAVGAGYNFQMSSRAMQRVQNEANPTSQAKFHKKVNKVKVDVTDWLESLNDQDSFINTMMKVVTDLETTGNAYIEIGRTTRGRIGYMGHIPAVTMRVRRLRDGFVQIIGEKVVYFRNFGAKNPDPIGKDPEPNEVLHLKKYSPLNTYYGAPDIISAAASVRGDQEAEAYNLDFFSNKAVPRYIVTLKGAKLAPDAEEKLFRFLQTNLKGQHHRTLFIPLPADSEGNKVEFKLEPVETKVQEASFEKYRKNNRDNVLMAHQVPLSKLGLEDGGSVGSSLAQERTFRDQVVGPLQSYVEKIVSQVISEATDMVILKFNEVSLIDEASMAKIHEIYATIGAIKLNEIRDDIGRPQIEGLDEAAEKAKQEERDARDRQRSQQASDSPDSATGRNPKGSGAKEDE